MRVYKCCLGQSELVGYFNPSALYVICAPNFPASLRTALFSNADNEGVVFDIGQGELLRTAVKWKRNEVNLQSPEVQSLMRNQKRQTLYQRYEVEIKSIITVMEEKLKKMEEFAKYSNVQPLLHEDDTEEWHPYTDIEAVVYSCIGDLQTLISNLESGEMPAEGVIEARRIYFAVAD